jgi:hypothetical protein
MIVPNRDPRELLVASNEIQVGTVSREPPAVVVESEDLVIGLGDTADAVSPAVISVLILIDVIAKMNNVVNGILLVVSLVLHHVGLFRHTFRTEFPYALKNPKG